MAYDEETPLMGGNRRGRALTFDESLLYNRDYRPYRIPDANKPSGYRLAKPGEDEDEKTGAPAEAYSVMCTSYTCFGEFGVGVGLYFRQLIFLAVVFFIAGSMTTPAILLNGINFPWNWVVDSSIFPDGTAYLVWGSAVGPDRQSLSFWTHGMVEIGLFLFLLLAAIISNARERKAAYEIDSLQRRAQGYAVMITNPLEDVRDPDYYLPYLTPFGEVVMITLALDNGQLLQYLAKERELKDRYPTLNVSSFKGVKCTLWKRVLHALTLGRWEDGEVLVCRWAELTENIDKLVAGGQDFKVKRVYAVFNSERSQRACLAAMSPGLSHTLAAGVATPPTRILHAVRPAEPSEVLWSNLHYRTCHRLMWKIASALAGGAILLLSFLVLYNLTSTELRQLGKPPGQRNNITMNLRLVLTGVVIATVNAILPAIMRETSRYMEKPLTTSDMSESITFKLLVARCLNTAIFQYLVTPYAQTLRPRSLVVLATVFIADCLAPLIALIDPPRLFRQWVLAPLEHNPTVTMAYFKPQPWSLAERQTDMIKTVFLGLFYSAIMPTCLYITSLSMIILYWADKTRLFTRWERPPPVDPPLAGATRDFLSICLLGHVVMTRIFYANWPFNYEREEVPCGFLYCSSTKPWLTPSQSAIISILGIFYWTIVVVVVRNKSWGPIRSAWTFFTSKMVYLADASSTKYRQCEGIGAYVPTVRADPLDPYCQLLLAADVTNLPKEYVPVPEGGGKQAAADPRSRSLLNSKTRKIDPRMFSVVKYYPPRVTLRVDPTGHTGPVEVPIEDEEEDEYDNFASRDCPSLPTVLGKMWGGGVEERKTEPPTPTRKAGDGVRKARHEIAVVSTYQGGVEGIDV